MRLNGPGSLPSSRSEPPLTGGNSATSSPGCSLVSGPEYSWFTEIAIEGSMLRREVTRRSYTSMTSETVAASGSVSSSEPRPARSFSTPKNKTRTCIRCLQCNPEEALLTKAAATRSNKKARPKSGLISPKAFSPTEIVSCLCCLCYLCFRCHFCRHEAARTLPGAPAADRLRVLPQAWTDFEAEERVVTQAVGPELL